MIDPADILEAIEKGDAFWSQHTNAEVREAYGVGQRVEAAFDFLRRGEFDNAKQRQSLIPGEKLGEFVVVRPLGSGGMGQVYQALQVPLNRVVALKVCDPVMALQPFLRQRFETEAKSLAQLKNPNVVPILTTGEDRGYLYLAMEYVAGPNLAIVLDALRGAAVGTSAISIVRAVLRAEVTSSSTGRFWANSRTHLDKEYIDWVIATMLEVIRATATIHKAGLLHLDIKPANIVVQPDGTPIIVDFGLATNVGGEFSSGNFPIVLGTPDYAAPEQVSGGRGPATPASDVFAIGVTFYECLTLMRPFEHIQKLRTDRTAPSYVSARQRNPRISWELEAIVHKCLEHQPSRRYANAMALFDDMARYLENKPISAKSTRMRRLRHWITEKPSRTVFVAWPVFIGILILIGGLANWFTSARDDYVKLIHSADARFSVLFSSLELDPELLDSVIELYTACIQVRSESEWCRMQRAILYYHSQRLDEAVVDLDILDGASLRRASVYELLARSHEQRGDLGKSTMFQSRMQRIYPSKAEDLFWLGLNALLIRRNSDLANYYWSACLLVEPNPDHLYGPRDSPIVTNLPTYNVHFLARTLRAYHCLDGQKRDQELELSRELRSDLADARELPDD